MIREWLIKLLTKKDNASIVAPIGAPIKAHIETTEATQPVEYKSRGPTVSTFNRNKKALDLVKQGYTISDACKKWAWSEDSSGNLMVR